MRPSASGNLREDAQVGAVRSISCAARAADNVHAPRRFPTTGARAAKGVRSRRGADGLGDWRRRRRFDRCFGHGLHSNRVLAAAALTARGPLWIQFDRPNMRRAVIVCRQHTGPRR